MNRLLQNRTVRFVVTGAAAAALFYALTFAFIRFGAVPFWGTLGAYVLAFCVSYTVQQAWTFGGEHRHRDAFPRYATAQICCAVATSLIGLAAGHIGLLPAPLSLVTTLFGSAMSYGLSRFWVFAER